MSRAPVMRHAIDLRIGDRGRVVDVLDGDRRARQHAGAPAEAGRERDLGIALLDHRRADQIVERAVEVAAAIEQRPGRARPRAQAPPRTARAPCRSRPSSRHRARSRRRTAGSACSESPSPPRPAHRDRAGRGICRCCRTRSAASCRPATASGSASCVCAVRITSMPGTRAASLRSTSKPLCESSTTSCAPVAARLLDIGAHVLLADAERPFREHPARIGDRRIGETPRPSTATFTPPRLEHLVGVEHRLFPFGVAHIQRRGTDSRGCRPAP